MGSNPELRVVEERLSEERLDFSETFVRVGQLKGLLTEDPAAATENTVAVLAALLASDRHLAQTQAFHLFKGIASTLALIGCQSRSVRAGRQALQVLLPAATESLGEKQRALARTVGTLPVNITAPRVDFPDTRRPVRAVSLGGVLAHTGTDSAGDVVYLGRSLVVPLARRPEVAVIKMTRRGENPDGLAREARWMDYLAGLDGWQAGRFEVPRPMCVDGDYLFKPIGMPGLKKRVPDIDPASASAIAFTVHRDYFVYPNDHRPDAYMPYDRFRRVLLRAAGIFGELAAAGIVHTAPIPLFHNRAQRQRRDDGGIYEWDRGGRLDQWLVSSRFPNFGPTGMRDFEHLVALGGNDGRELYRHIGNHLLSLILVAGSYFRCKAPHMVGVDEEGTPLDVRFLFDREKLGDLVNGVFNAYFTGFSNSSPAPEPLAGTRSLVAGLIDQMGVDRHMREVLRVEDQKRMSDRMFGDYLVRYNVQAGKDSVIEKACADIEVQSGPHLGEFNGPISVPELTGFLRSAAATIVAGRFLAQRFPDNEDSGRG